MFPLPLIKIIINHSFIIISAICFFNIATSYASNLVLLCGGTGTATQYMGHKEVVSGPLSRTELILRFNETFDRAESVETKIIYNCNPTETSISCQYKKSFKLDDIKMGLYTRVISFEIDINRISGTYISNSEDLMYSGHEEYRARDKLASSYFHVNGRCSVTGLDKQF